MYLLRLAAVSSSAIGVLFGSAQLRADPLFSYIDPTDAPPRAAPVTAAPALSTVPSASSLPAMAPAIGNWSTVVSAAPPPSPMRLANAAPALTEAAPRHLLPTPKSTAALLTGPGHSLSGIASYYWQEQKTATGEQFNKRDLTAAHRTLPFGTKVRVTRLDNGSSVVVRINDRGPFKPGRVIDLSERAAEDIGMTGRGLTDVRLEVLGQ